VLLLVGVLVVTIQTSIAFLGCALLNMVAVYCMGLKSYNGDGGGFDRRGLDRRQLDRDMNK
jgi:hypothetical protein